MDLQMDPNMGPARLILGDPCPKNSLHGPSKVLYTSRPTTEKLKSTAWFEVNPTFGSRDIAFLDFQWANWYRRPL